MENCIIHPVGKISSRNGEFALIVDKRYVPALEGLDGFGYVQILWWFDGCDNAESRNKLANAKPYRHGPDTLGVFASRSPERPNPIALSCAYITYIDQENGVIGLAHIDANDGSPVLDIKPYTPSIDRVEHPIVPKWCAHWPANYESSGDFDWESEFCF